jgi:single-strand DNA-binding protein
MRLLCFGQKSAQGRWTKSAQREGVNIMGTSINMQVTGFVGSDPQVRQVGEQSVASFSVAVSRKNRAGEKQTLWVRVNCWNKLSDVAAQYVKKGSLVQVTTEWLRPSAWVDQSGTPQASLDMDANRLVLLDRLESDEPENGENIPF